VVSTTVGNERSQAPTGGKAESILAAAKQAFLANGYGAVSMDLIARVAGASKATVYAHFAGKEELFEAVIERECERYFASFSAGEFDTSDVRAALAVLGRRFLDLVLSPDASALYRIIVAEVTRFPALGEVFWRAGPERERVQIEGFLRSAIAAGRLSPHDPRLGAEQFISLVRGDIQLRQVLRLEAVPGAGEIGRAADAAVDTFMRAFSAPPSGGPVDTG
jgi:TetR/AcrR family transcriptional regulator, mexJK operon transcriptional repressor